MTRSNDTLCQNVHGIIHLNIHVITNCSQFILLVTDGFSILTLDFPRRTAVPRPATCDYNSTPIFVGLVGFVSLILDVDRHFGFTDENLNHLHVKKGNQRNYF